MSNAKISDCGKYRYWLRRSFDESVVKRSIVFVMLNPSIADGFIDDPTIRRCIGFAKKFGYNNMFVINLYAYRSTNPKQLWEIDDPVGKENDHWLGYFLKNNMTIVCAWGSNAKLDRVNDFKLMCKTSGITPFCFGLTKGGNPKHPLYLSNTSELTPYE